MGEKPRTVYILILLWLTMGVIFAIWGLYSLAVLIQIPQWTDVGALLPPLHFGYFFATTVFFVFSLLFVLFSYGTMKAKPWAWSAGLIITTIFLIVLGFMTASLMVNAVLFLDLFSVAGLVTVVITFMADLGIVYYLTRPATKLYLASITVK